MRYTENLVKKGEHRVRLTKQLRELVETIEEEILDVVEEGTGIIVNGFEYEVIYKSSNVGGCKFIRIIDPDGPGGVIARGRELGSTFFLHGDFHSEVRVATKELYLHFANNVHEIMQKFEANEDRVINELQAAFDKLKKFSNVK